MEPEERYVQPYIQPLVDQPGSTYRHTFLAGAHPIRYWESYREVHEDPALLPPRPELPVGDPKLRQLDPSLLVIGNLERMYVSRRIDVASLLSHQTPYAALANDLFHRSGLVRMLWWAPERIKHHVFPRNPALQSSFSNGIEMGVEPREVAGVTSVQVLQDTNMFSRKRPALYDKIATENVAKRMSDSGLSPPEGRELLGADYLKGTDVSKNAHKSPFESMAKTAAELQAKIDSARARMKELAVADNATMSKLQESMEYPQSHAMISEYAARLKISRVRGPLFLDLAIGVLNFEANYKELEEKGVEPQSLNILKAAIFKFDADLTELAKKFSVNQHTIMIDVQEEQIAFYMTPQHSALDRRTFEPLKLNETDFFPPSNNLFLMDLMPKTRDLSVPDLADNREASRICAEMLRQLFAARTRSVVDALNTFAVNAGQDLVPMVPTICDVRRGGRLDARNMRVRMLTEEMIEGLVKAFFEWPFRPQTWEVTAMGHDAAVEGKARDDREEEAVAE